MARGDARTDVELVEDDGDDAPGAPRDAGTGPTGRGARTAPGPTADDAPRRTRRRVLALAAVLVAVIVAVAVVGETVARSREQARVAAVAGVPGVVDVADGPVRVLRTAADEGVRRASARTSAGLLVSASAGQDGEESVRAIDPTDGSVAWETTLIPRGQELHVPPGGELVPSRGWCRAHGAGEDLLVCLADNGLSLVGRGTLTQVRPTVTRLLLLDARDGSVVTDLSGAVGDPMVSRSSVVLDDLVVLGGADGGGAHVRAVTADGTVAWQGTFPTRTTTAFGAHVELHATTDGVAVATSDALRLLDARGVTRQEVELSSADHVRGTAGDAALVQTPAGRTVVVRPAGVQRLPGDWVELTVDDGSTPGLLLTSDDDGLHAWDAAGTPLWTSDRRVGGRDALSLAGRVLVGQGAGVVALDGVTGEQLWRVDGLLPDSGLTTDGRHLFVLGPRPGASDPEVLVALDPTDGDVAWRVTLPVEGNVLRSVLGLLAVYSFAPLSDGTWPVITLLG
ncbi:outer membrane protein assembly factor BamB family protein [Cellulomonas phragmiteti]|uniref:Pyrrolo-quinoline quinone repeat domain-containing protein n=1 Tax=Cellulomonas phragmiteti TaxID=478780 RepID=A0ABQ4DP95_9CELL|nr:PQQ-binding-like beta-propeller repeat protein [Cellulomonas phragmiteti]GIG41175.1 hypothetical protein Cph01nite_29370 [Cellulomonas phragmiteti]